MPHKDPAERQAYMCEYGCTELVARSYRSDGGREDWLL
jgi:hypothetical protein